MRAEFDANFKVAVEANRFLEAVEALANRIGAVDDADVDRVRDELRQSLLELNLRLRSARQSDR